MFPWYIKYPNQNDEILNLDWILSTIENLVNEVANFVSLSTIKYADPIQWNITKQYEKNTVVIDPLTGSAYISTKPVPAGVGLNNTDYWNIIFTLDVISANKNITIRDDANNMLATFESSIGDWLLWNGTLYKVIRQINIGNAYVADYNISKYTVENFLKQYIGEVKDIIGSLSDLQLPATSVVQAINEVVQVINAVVDALTGQIGDLEDLTISAVDLVTAINNVVSIIGDLEDLEVSATSVVQAINNVLGAIKTQIGDLEDLQISATSVVGAINNVVDAITLQIGDLSDLQIPATSVVAAINNAVDALNQNITKADRLYRFNGKKILIIGDSNSNEVPGVTNWVTVLRNILPATTIDNVSYNGAIFMGAGGQAKNYYDNISAHYDYIIVACGTNDCYHQAGIGVLDLGTTNSWNDFGAALSSFYNAVNNKDVNAQVCFVSPIKNSGMATDGITRVTPLEVYRMMINRACALFGWTLIDAGHNAPHLEPYNATNAAKWLPDGTHMSEDYAPIFCNYILDKILSGGDTPCGKGIQSTIVLNSLFNTGYTGDLICEFNSDGSATIDLNIASTSVGAGVAIIPVSGLPTYLRHKYINYFFCTDIFNVVGIGRVMTNGDIQIFPLVTSTTALIATIHIPATTSNESSYQTII